MSRFTGKQSNGPKAPGQKNKGVLCAYKDKKYREAIARQAKLIQQGAYAKHIVEFGIGMEVLAIPAPIKQFLRKGHTATAAGRILTPEGDIITTKEVENEH